ncbi:MAG: helix-turn-helix transcriptional regulator [Phycisphaeraceae bacterium]|nr:helix-turn-helix transcriptional regulator [Phycisphaeraceae bacterium]
MGRPSSHADVFAAIAEPRRRSIIELLGREGEQPVGALVVALDLPQPVVSKHLAVLREVGIVAVTRRGRERVYRLSPRQLKAVHDWVSTFEKHWTHQLGRIKRRAESLGKE